MPKWVCQRCRWEFFPGFGGCVRLPRLIGPKTALEWIVSGRQQTAEIALASKAVDFVVPAERIRDTAIATLQTAAQRGDWQARRRARASGIAGCNPSEITSLQASAAKAAEHYPAALAAIELVASSAYLSRDAALVMEAPVFARVASTPTATALIQLFIDDQLIKKKTGVQMRIARKVHKAAVIGAGVMGG